MSPTRAHILVVDCQREVGSFAFPELEEHDRLTTHYASTYPEIRQILKTHPIRIALVDTRLEMEARSFSSSSRESAPTAGQLVARSQMLIEGLAAGCARYVIKEDLSTEMVVPSVDAVLRRVGRGEESQAIAVHSVVDLPIPGLIGTSSVMGELGAQIQRVCRSDRPVLVTGATGTGKEVVATALHSLGPQREAPFLDLNCGAVPEQLIESQLFGHDRGAFTGADRRHDGYFSAAQGGTLFLDEIAEMPLHLQTQLLRVLETGVYRRVGSNENCSFSGRIIAATHADLSDRVRQGTFREDLFYRLNVFHLRIPPLRERPEDIPALIHHFAAAQPRRLRFSDEAMSLLMQADWPGNVRELRNLIDRVAVLTDEDPVCAAGLSRVLESDSRASKNSLESIAHSILLLEVGDKLNAIQDALVESALKQSSGNKSAAARLLGVHRKVVERRTAWTHL